VERTNLKRFKTAHKSFVLLCPQIVMLNKSGGVFKWTNLLFIKNLGFIILDCK
jgi:hypothetical protein